MFFISTHADGGCTLPILSSIYPNVHPVVFILIYYIGFNIVACIMALLQFGFVSIDKSFVKLVGPKDFKFNAYKEDYESLQK